MQKGSLKKFFDIMYKTMYTDLKLYDLNYIHNHYYTDVANYDFGAVLEAGGRPQSPHLRGFVMKIFRGGDPN